MTIDMRLERELINLRAGLRLDEMSVVNMNAHRYSDYEVGEHGVGNNARGEEGSAAASGGIEVVGAADGTGFSVEWEVSFDDLAEGTLSVTMRADYVTRGIQLDTDGVADGLLEYVERFVVPSMFPLMQREVADLAFKVLGIVLTLPIEESLNSIW